MKFLRLLVLSIVLPFAVLAQTNYKEGFVVKSTGDTLKGYINYREWANTPDYIEFKPSLNDKEPVKILPVDLRGFTINGLDNYITYIGPVSMDQNVFPDLPSKFDNSVIQDTVFMQVTYQGNPLSLLRQTDNLKSRFFVIENTDQPVELKFYQYYIENSRINSVKSFTSVLLPLAQKYNPLNTKVEQVMTRSMFRESDLLQIIKLINNDNTEKSSGNSGSRFFAGISFNRTTTEFDGLYSGKAYSYIPQLNAGADFFLNKYTQRFYLRGQISLSANHPRFKEIKESFLTRSNDYRFNQYTFSLAPQLVYNFYNTDSFKTFVGVGVSLNYSIYSNNLYTYGNSSSMITAKDYYTFTNIWTNILVRAGMIINKKTEIFVTYTPPAPFTDYFAFSVSSSHYGLGVHYLFGK